MANAVIEGNGGAVEPYVLPEEEHTEEEKAPRNPKHEKRAPKNKKPFAPRSPKAEPKQEAAPAEVKAEETPAE